MYQMVLSLPQGHGWGMLLPLRVSSVILVHWESGEGRLILCTGGCHAVIFSAKLENRAVKLSWATVTGLVNNVSLQKTWSKMCWHKLHLQYYSWHVTCLPEVSSVGSSRSTAFVSTELLRNVAFPSVPCCLQHKQWNLLNMLLCNIWLVHAMQEGCLS